MTFKRPAKFSLAAYWKSSTTQLGQQRERYTATLALAAEAEGSLRGWCRVSPAPEVQRTPAIPDKWTVLHVFFESQEEARFVALGFGSRAHVLAPANSARRGHARDERSRGPAANRCVAQLIPKIPPSLT